MEIRLFIKQVILLFQYIIINLNIKLFLEQKKIKHFLYRLNLLIKNPVVDLNLIKPLTERDLKDQKVAEVVKKVVEVEKVPLKNQLL